VTPSRLGLSPRVLGALAVVYVVWGSTYLAIKVGIETIPPFLMASSRFTIASVLLVGWCVARGRWAAARPTAANWRAAAVVGGSLLVGGNGAVTWAEQRLDSGLAALLVATVPLWMAAFDRLSGADRLARGAVAGLVLGFAGVALLLTPSGNRIALVPALAVLGGAMSWAAGSIYSRRAALPDDPLVATAMEMTAGAVLFAVLGAVRGEPGQLDLARISVASAAAVGYLATAGSLAAFTCYVWLLRNARTSVVGTYAYVNPVVAVALGWAVLGERVSARTLVAGAIVVAAVAIMVMARRPPVPPASAPPQPERVASGSRR